MVVLEALGVVVAVVFVLGWLAVLVLWGPIRWSWVSPRFGLYFARRIEPISPRLSRWYQEMAEELQREGRRTDAR